MKRALISVSYKAGIIPFAKELVALGFELLSTGGTKTVLTDAGIPCTSVDDITGFKEMLDGRVKTLHPSIHAGLLSVRDNPKHNEDLHTNNIAPIDLICINLYPFEDTINNPNATFEDAIEQIDIGGPAMLRSAAKNYESVTTICDHNDYDRIIDEIKLHGDTTVQTKKELSAKAFRRTAHYDATIASYLTTGSLDTIESKTMPFLFHQALRYGENPHQKAVMLQSSTPNPYSLFATTLLNGKPLSYNNIQDANAAINILAEHQKPTVVSLKHMNPCGVGTADDIVTAFDFSCECDPISIFGGVVAVNRTVTLELAYKLSKMFLEIIIAPGYEEDALTTLKKKKNVRILELDTSQINTDKHTFTHINGGILIQDIDRLDIPISEYQCVTEQKPSGDMLEELQFAWRVVKHVKSNAIVVSKGTQTVGIGAGQMNRVGAAKIALEWARDRGNVSDLVLASDAFFPFSDVVRLAASFGVKAIIQPGGSIRDQESIDACNELGIVMVFTNHRHFKH